MSEAPSVLFNPLDPSFRIDPYSVYRRMRAEAPIHQSAFGAWVFCRYADCMAILRDPRWSSDGRKSNAFKEAVEQGTIDLEQDGSRTQPFLFLDPPDHTRLRGLVSKAFTPKTVERLRPRAQKLVDGLLDEVAEKGSMDVIEDLAYPLPVTVICELLGVPAEDHTTFREWSREAARSLDPEEVLPPEAQEQRRQTFQSFSDYFESLIGERRKEPREDLISELIAAEEEGDKLSEEELLATCILILIAGHETTVNLIGNGMLALLRHPDQLRMLQDDPGLAASAVEELLRYDPPVQMTGRTALEDVEIGGATIDKGGQSILLVAAAGRDPEQFADPDRLDITRGDSHHLAFGQGIHSCIGAPLARIEGEIAFRSLTQRFRGLELLDDNPEYKENIILRGLASLPVGFEPAS